MLQNQKFVQLNCCTPTSWKPDIKTRKACLSWQEHPHFWSCMYNNTIHQTNRYRTREEEHNPTPQLWFKYRATNTRIRSPRLLAPHQFSPHSAPTGILHWCQPDRESPMPRARGRWSCRFAPSILERRHSRLMVLRRRCRSSSSSCLCTGVPCPPPTPTACSGTTTDATCGNNHTQRCVWNLC